MAHRRAKLTGRARLDLVRQVEVGWPWTEVARQFRVSRAKVAKRIPRRREEGKAGPENRSFASNRNPRVAEVHNHVRLHGGIGGTARALCR